jgi:hypothetical protein
MTRKTQGVYDLVQLALQEIAPPYSENVIEEVCLVIENNRNLFRKYLHLSDELKHWVVNNWIGQYTKEITGGQTLREVEARRSKLITGYTKLFFSPQPGAPLPTP